MQTTYKNTTVDFCEYDDGNAIAAAEHGRIVVTMVPEERVTHYSRNVLGVWTVVHVHATAADYAVAAEIARSMEGGRRDTRAILFVRRD